MLERFLLTEDPFEKLILIIFMEMFNNPDFVPEDFKCFENFFLKWRTWNDETCSKFFQNILKVDVEENIVDLLNCRGYPIKVVLYRMLQVNLNTELFLC